MSTPDICARMASRISQWVDDEPREDWWQYQREYEQAASAITALAVALRDIAEPLASLKRGAEAKGHQLSWLAGQIANDPEHLKSIARAALAVIEPKP